MNNIQINVIRDTEPIVVPNTGTTTFESNNSGMSSTVLFSVIVGLLCFAVIVFICSRLIKKLIVAKKFKMVINKKAISVTAVLSLFMVVLCGLITIDVIDSISGDVKAIDDSSTQNTLSIEADDINIDVKVRDEKVFAYAEGKVKVNSSTGHGYSLSMYASSDEIVSEKSEDVIKSVPKDVSSALSDNTWGIALEKPGSESSTIWKGLPTSADDALSIKKVDTATSENDLTTVYYGTYLTPDLSEGTYSGPTINYVIIANPVIIYDANLSHDNGASFDTSGSVVTNSVVYGSDQGYLDGEYVEPDSYDYYAFYGWATSPEIGSDTIVFANEEEVMRAILSGVVGSELRLYAIWKCADGLICYNANGATGESKMAAETINYDNDFILYPSNFSRDGYGFAGWNTEPDGSGRMFGPMETVSASEFSDGDVNLYAIWVKESSQYTMQTFTGEACADLTAATYDADSKIMTPGDTIALKDERDGNVYFVARLTDGNCWMSENLRLDDSAELSSENTQNPMLPLTNIWWYSSDNYLDPKPTSNHLSPSSDAWCNAYVNECFYQSFINTNNTAHPAEIMTSLDNNIYLYGNYYNYYSASVGAYDATSRSICPSGWKIPRGEVVAQYSHAYLSQTIGGPTSRYNGYNEEIAVPASKIFRSYPFNYVYSGAWGGTQANSKGTTGEYWADTSYGLNMNYILYTAFTDTVLIPGSGYGSRYSGHAIRCVLVN